MTQDEIEEIINNGLSSIIKLIEFINFNKNHPQNHTFCTTNIHGKYASVLNTNTKEVELQRKIDIYDKILYYGILHIKKLKNKIKDKVKRKLFKEKITELETKIFGFGDRNYKKIVFEQIAALSYSKKHIVRETWDKYIKDNISFII